MTVFPHIEIPDDLALEAAGVPGLRERLLSFLKAEVLLHKREKSQRSTQAQELVSQALQDAERMREEGMTRERARAEFAKLYKEVVEYTAANS